MDNLIFEKYKPKILDDFYLDNNKKTLLKFFLKTANLNLLIIGNICTGKTSILNILINDYCNFNQSLITNNVMYISSLKDNGINYFRNDIKIFSQTNSLFNKKKLVIIDDLENINEQSQYILLGLINKYKYKINFILTVNNYQKILDGFLSHLNIISLEYPTYTYLYNLTKSILEKENINIDLDLIDEIIINSNNSIKNILNIIEKFILYNNKITKNNIHYFLYYINNNNYYNFTNYCLNNEYDNAINILKDIYDIGYNIIDIYDSYSNYIKNTDDFCEKKKFIILKVLSKYIIIYHNINENILELYFFVNRLINNLKNEDL